MTLTWTAPVGIDDLDLYVFVPGAGKDRFLNWRQSDPIDANGYGTLDVKDSTTVAMEHGFWNTTVTGHALVTGVYIVCVQAPGSVPTPEAPFIYQVDTLVQGVTMQFSGTLTYDVYTYTSPECYPSSSDSPLSANKGGLYVGNFTVG